jgi:hypothetical protein
VTGADAFVPLLNVGSVEAVEHELSVHTEYVIVPVGSDAPPESVDVS